MRIATFLFLAALATPLAAQLETDPREKMQEILDQVAKEMQQIDKLLQESSRSRAAAEGMARNAERLEKLLDSVGKAQRDVVKGIDELLNEAQKMKSQQQQQQQQQNKRQRDKPQQRQQGEPGEREQQRRRRLEKPQQRQGESKDPKDSKDPSREANRQEKRDKGKNAGAGDPRRRDTEKVNGKRIQGAWGDLPDYLLKHGRGSMPNVPEKYRKYLEALTKEGHKKKGR